MCGITGIVDFGKTLDLAPIMTKMMEVIHHRGPDGEGKELIHSACANIGFGHKRLSVIDLDERAAQPMKSQDDRYVLTFNGEIYNYADIRQELIRSGETFLTESDTEVILVAWSKWGNACLEKFRGMFAFSLLDKENEQLYVVRDRPGVKPLYYSFYQDKLLFSSELKSIVNSGLVEKKVDANNLALYLKYGYYPQPHTALQGVKKLPPAHIMTLDLRTRSFKLEKYWNYDSYFSLPKLTFSEKEILDQLDKRLCESAKLRMVSDVPVGVFLSGGYDSSLVTAVLQKGMTERLKTFTIGFEDRKYDEASHAKAVAEHLGTDHTEVYLTAGQAQDIIPELGGIYDEPFGDSSAIPTTLVSRVARERVTVALSADGGDELFGGYNKHLSLLHQMEKLKKVPLKKVQSLGLKFLKPALQNHLFSENSPRRYDKLTKLLGRNFGMETALKLSSENMTDSEVDDILIWDREYRKSMFDRTYPSLNNIDRLLTADYHTYLVDDILTKVDRATMSVSLEGREPLLDHKLAEFVAQIPSDFKIRNGSKKYILKQLTHRYIPESIMDRPKKGFSVPVKDWMRNELSELLHDTLNEEAIQHTGLFNVQELERYKKGYMQGSDHDFNPIWFLFSFQQWYNAWMK